MTALVVVGTQWGDEGKGKIVDLLTEQADAVVRYQGGNNAGHTVMFGDETHILHLIPSGILRDTMSILGNGVVIDLPELLKEIEELRENGVEVQGKLHVSARSHLVMPWHRLIDQLREKDKGEKKIGTTGRGIGPAYEDKVGRRGIRMGDLRHPETLVKQTLKGASLLFQEQESAVELRRRVTSPGGTTEAALKRFAEGKVDVHLKDGLEQAYLRARELSGRE